MIDPKQPRTDEANGTEAAHPFVSVVGAAWLLMGQPGVTETRAIADSPTPRPAAGAGPDVAQAPRVTIVELRRPVRLPNDTPGTGASKRADPTTLNAGRNGLPRISKARRTSR